MSQRSEEETKASKQESGGEAGQQESGGKKQGGAAGGEQRASGGKVDLNSASAEELASCVEGIGDTRAQKIVQDRDANGPFATIEEVRRVEGIGDDLVEVISRSVIIQQAA